MVWHGNVGNCLGSSKTGIRSTYHSVPGNSVYYGTFKPEAIMEAEADESGIKSRSLSACSLAG